MQKLRTALHKQYTAAKLKGIHFEVSDPIKKAYSNHYRLSLLLAACYGAHILRMQNSKQTGGRKINEAESRHAWDILNDTAYVPADSEPVSSLIL